MGGTFSVIGPKKRVRQPKSRSHSKKHDAIVHYAFEPFGDLIIAYNACKKSIEDVEKLESARTEAELLRATIDEILKRIARHKDEDVKWSDHNGIFDSSQREYRPMLTWCSLDRIGAGRRTSRRRNMHGKDEETHSAAENSFAERHRSNPQRSLFDQQAMVQRLCRDQSPVDRSDTQAGLRWIHRSVW
jgi:hypothetical protein